MNTVKDNWCYKEFASLNIGDKRLKARVATVAGDLLNQPTASIQTASGAWCKAKAAYRLFDHDKLSVPALLKVHQHETVQRLKKSKETLFFAIQDTTTLNYTHHPKTTGTGKIKKDPGFDQPVKGFFLHNTLLLAESGVPLGLLDQKIYIHEASSTKESNHKKRPINDKESYRWIEGLQTTAALSQNKNIITLCDRESDIFEFFVEAESLQKKILVRAGRDRILIHAAKDCHQTLWPYMEMVTESKKHTIHIPARHNKSARNATLDIKFSRVILKAPQRCPEAKINPLSDLPIHVIWVNEPNPPKNIEPLEWMLLTNVPVFNEEDALKISQWYRYRWQIECFHRILKSGCKIEDCRLETYERLKKYATLKSIIAFRLFWLTMINRASPTTSCHTILAEHEWKALYCYANNVALPVEKPPSVQEAITMLAKLGGFLGRKNDKQPGMTYIWRGWEKLTELAKLWLILNNEGLTYG